jgi:hypothetical protein
LTLVTPCVLGIGLVCPPGESIARRGSFIYRLLCTSTKNLRVSYECLATRAALRRTSCGVAPERCREARGVLIHTKVHKMRHLCFRRNLENPLLGPPSAPLRTRASEPWSKNRSVKSDRKNSYPRQLGNISQGKILDLTDVGPIAAALLFLRWGANPTRRTNGRPI